MSHDGNTQVLEAYQDTFNESVSVENWAMARAVIGDLRDEGFSEQAEVLERALVEAQNHDAQ